MRQADNTLPSCLDSKAGTEATSLHWQVGMLTVKCNNGSPVLAPGTAVFQRGHEVVAQHWGRCVSMHDLGGATNVVAGTKVSLQVW